MRKLFHLVLFLLIICTNYSFAQQGKITINAERNTDRSVVFNFSKHDPGTMTVQFKFNNLENTSVNTSVYQSKGYSGSILTLRPLNKEQNITYSYSYRYIRGKLKPKFDANFVYGLPHAEFADVIVSEANYLSARYFGNTQPEDWKSYYLHTKNEENILASRKGLVVEVVDEYEDFSDDESFKSKNNKIIIEHEDGTLATYGALKKGSVKVKVGDTVFPKTQLATNSKRGDNRYSFAFSIMYLKAADLYVNEGKNVSNDVSLYGFVTPKFSVNSGEQMVENNKTYQAVWSDALIVKEMSKKELKKYKSN